MNNRLVAVLLLSILLVSLAGYTQANATNPIDQPALVFVKISSADDVAHFASTQLALYAQLDGGFITGAGAAGQKSLNTAGLAFTVLDPRLGSGSYYLASTHASRPTPDFAAYGTVLHKTDQGVLLRLDPSQVEPLVTSGAELQAISLTPKPLPEAQSEPIVTELTQPDPFIQGIIDQVTQTQVYTYDNQLAGFQPVWVDGAWYTITSRNTYSGTPIQKATHFLGQHLQNLGMNVEYQEWNSPSNPNVIGQITGINSPQDIYIIGAHIDDTSRNGLPVGADDNASGSVATLLAADILSQYQWGCTLRFAFWTGEEQGLLGSRAYAQRSYQQGENILGYLNLDMIAWNTTGSTPDISLLYKSDKPQTFALAQLFSNVVDAYNLDLVPSLGFGANNSDHASFWNYGFTSILAIEDDLHGDFNPFYHTTQDTPAHTDPGYFTEYVKASLATFAHMTGCLITPEHGHLAGHVTAVEDGSPLSGATVSAENEHGHSYPSLTDTSGYYTMTLPVDTYTVTASAAGFSPAELSGVEVISGTTTTHDFALEAICEPVTGLDFSWLPDKPFNSDLVSFTSTVSGTQPIDFQWDFGDTLSGTGRTVTHTYADSGSYDVSLTASNRCSSQPLIKPLTVLHLASRLFLPAVKR